MVQVVALPARVIAPDIKSVLHRMLHRAPNPALLSGGCLSTKPKFAFRAAASSPYTVTLDLNDAALVFEKLALSNADAHARGGALRLHLDGAAAMVLPTPARCRLLHGPVIAPDDETALEFAVFNLSMDEMYVGSRGRRGTVGGAWAPEREGGLHSPWALNLSLMPLPGQINEAKLMRMHHPYNTFEFTYEGCASSAGISWSNVLPQFYPSDTWTA